MKKKNLSHRQRIFFNVASVVGLIGIYFFMSSQTDMTDGFAIGVFAVVGIAVVWACERYVRDNVKG